MIVTEVGILFKERPVQAEAGRIRTIGVFNLDASEV